ncbi:hypothetical protein [Chondromyces crocatus]|uniref:Uncharacterized protein n=1 Tax=Chondromyces crocatus TaxID=52 RepID=A0A0K1E840_CHOCO|nr:hypothetical protein [Chondromyces crocatus]AKT37024.1 uncharacterized protein CMC5_011500 [Chondromyces crocatus]
MSPSEPPFDRPEQRPSTAGHAADFSALHRILEEAHAELRRAAVLLERVEEPPFDPVPPARAMERALASLYDAFDARREPGDASQRVIAHVDEAVAFLERTRLGGIPGTASMPSHGGVASADRGAVGDGSDPVTRIGEHLGNARRALARGFGVAGSVPGPWPRALQPLRASIDLPRLHDVARPSLVPPLDVEALTPTHAVALPPPIPPPRSFDELRDAVATLKQRAQAAREKTAEPPSLRPSVPPPIATAPTPSPPGLALRFDPALDEGAFLRERARTAFDEIAMAAMQRMPLPGDPWRGSLVLERRLLASLDLLASLGAPAIAHVPRLLADFPVKDPSRVFAASLILGSFAGRDALAAAERALFGASGLDEDTAVAVGAALAVAPHELLPLALRSLLRDAEPWVRAVAVDVLGRRGLATAEELHAATRDDPRVAVHAIVHLAVSFGVAPQGGFEPHLTADDVGLRHAALHAVALAGDPGRLARHLDGAPEGADAGISALLLALAGDEIDASRLMERARQRPTPALLAALGWAGAVPAVGLLLEMLSSAREELRVAAAGALDRITGAGLWEEVEVAAESLDVAVPPTPELGEPRRPRLAQIVSDPRDRPEAPAPDRVERPSTDPVRWRAFWEERGAAFPVQARHRMGQLYTPMVSLRELDEAPRSVEERRLLQVELVVRTGGVVPFDPRDFVVTQERALGAWGGPARAASGSPGRWSRPARKRV